MSDILVPIFPPVPWAFFQVILKVPLGLFSGARLDWPNLDAYSLSRFLC